MSLSNQDNNAKADERLGQAFYTNGRYNALFLGAAGLGFVVIYILSWFRFLGEPSPQLLYISGAIFFLALTQFPILALARQKKGIAANFLGTSAVIVFAILLVSFWEGVALVAILLIFITPVTAIFAGMPRKHYLQIALLLIAGTALIVYANTNPLAINRLRTDTTVAVASLAFLGATGLLLLTATVIARSSRYRSLRAQLLTSFIIIVSIPTVMAAILSAIGAYVNNESQVLNVLETVSKLKENQINSVIDSFKVEAVRINQDPDLSRNALKILTPGATDQTTLELYRTFARNRLLDFQTAEKRSYSEIMLLNIKGTVVVSTDKTREGQSLQSELFYREGSIGTFAGFSKNPAFGDANLIFSTRFHDIDGKVIRGILVFRTNSNLIVDIVESTPSFQEMETYLLDKDYHPLTKTRIATQTVQTQASKSILSSSNLKGDKGTYENYAGEIVLGYYQRIESLNAVFIAEVPRSFVLRSSINSLLGSATLAIFAILIAIAAVAISAASIAEPISALANIAQGFAAGNLSSRAAINRRDEIGALGNAYDQMAEQLQDIIGKLEQRVIDRTKDLENQSLRLRASAEIARDAAASHNLAELLDKAGALLQDRFALYHTGIFLLDNNKEFAVLTASPTEAGKQMIANNHKLRVGEVGIVGRVASTEEPRITLDTGTDAVFFNNPLLPKTRSEMALPLKVENRMIGVLDVQSDQPQAFDEDDIAIMQILADQLATAIERARLFQQVEQNLSDLRQAYGQFTREGWKTLGESGLLSKTGYRFDNIRIQSISETPAHGDEVMKTGTSVLYDRKNTGADENKVSIPIKLRGQTIGVVSANLKDGYTQTTLSTLELAIERLAQSLESARLYEQARLRADREQTIAQVAASISSSTEFDSILRTTVEEVGKSLGDAEVSIQIISNTDEHKAGE
jgi:GAF domain-containing protein/HAMP domain-containing protein